MIRIFLDFLVDLAIIMSVPGNHARFVKLIHKGNEVIGRDLEFGIGTMARDEDMGRKRETMTVEEEVGVEEDREKKKERTEQRKGEGKGRGGTWVQRC